MFSPELLSAAVYQLFIQTVKTRSLRLYLLKVLLYLLTPLRLHTRTHARSVNIWIVFLVFPAFII